MIVFLDFDGVLHPFGHDTFERVEALAAALDPFPEARIVVSSSWREIHDEAALKGFLGPLGKRMIGVTPVFPEEGLPDEEEWLGVELWSAIRQRECEAWIQENEPGASWVAIDDFQALFRKGCRDLLLCDPETGFSAENAEELSERLEAIRTGVKYRKGFSGR